MKMNIEARTREAKEALVSSSRQLGHLVANQKLAFGGLLAAVTATCAGLYFWRRNKHADEKTTLRVRPEEQAGWAVVQDGEQSNGKAYDTKREAVKVARDAAHKHLPSELVIHRTDGTIEDHHSYEA